MGYHNGYYEAASAKGSPYRKMLSALWRESPLPLLGPGQQLATMASLLHVDADGLPLVSALIERSGLDAPEWLRRYLDAYLVPWCTASTATNSPSCRTARTSSWCWSMACPFAPS